MSEWLLQLAKDQPLAFLFGLLAVWWVQATTTAGDVFVLVSTMLLFNAILQFGRGISRVFQRLPHTPPEEEKTRADAAAAVPSVPEQEKEEQVAPLEVPTRKVPKAGRQSSVDTEFEEAKLFVQAILVDGPVRSRELTAQAFERGLSRRMLRLVRADLKIGSFVRDGVWFVELPNALSPEVGRSRAGEGATMQK
jgi:hypothetical protein